MPPLRKLSGQPVSESSPATREARVRFPASAFFFLLLWIRLFDALKITESVITVMT